jgi:hypothetical protein
MVIEDVELLIIDKDLIILVKQESIAWIFSVRISQDVGHSDDGEVTNCRVMREYFMIEINYFIEMLEE